MMLRSLKGLRDYTIQAIDGDIGNIHAFLFDDLTWTVRYLVVETGGWLTGRQVLLSPIVVDEPDWERHMLPVRLTQEQIREAPPVNADKPVSRQMEEELHTHYGWSPYWRNPMPPIGAGAMATAQAIAATAEEEAEEEKERRQRDVHLRSSREVIGYHIQARDGEIGHVDDFIAEDDTWIIRYLVVDTRTLLPGKKVLVAPTWVEKVDWVGRSVQVDLSRETIKDSPEFDPSAPVNRRYEIRLYDYYGRPRYWH